MKHNKIFLQTISEAHKKDYFNSDQIGVFWINGNELQKICESYFLNKLEHIGLKHFSSGEKAKYTLIGFFIGALAFMILCFLIIVTFYIDKL